MTTVGVISHGCPKNLVDTELMLGYLDKAGYKGVWNYEVGVDENNTYKDLKANFDNLFAQYNAQK